jgi:mevalonate kinase
MTDAPVVERSACAKVILCGEHAVVYGRPAIALPLPNLRAHAMLVHHHAPFDIVAPNINEAIPAKDVATSTHPLARIVQLTLAHLSCTAPNATLTVTSAIPVGANLGSGAAVSIAIVRVLAAQFDVALTPETISALAYEVEKQHHGTPSGIDNTVIAHEQPVWFIKGQPPAPMLMTSSSTLADHGLRGRLVIGDTGFSTPTRVPVGDVRAGWEKDQARYEAIFDDIARIVERARTALLAHDLSALGAAMNDNHALLQTLDVSSPELDRLCAAARAAGAFGAKMSGGGRGGNMIAIAQDAEHASYVKDALTQVGAARVFV